MGERDDQPPDVLGSPALQDLHGLQDLDGVADTCDNCPTLPNPSQEHLDADGVLREALGKGLVVLLGQEGGRHQNGDLVSVIDRTERGSHRHLGLAEAHITAHESVHGGR